VSVFLPTVMFKVAE